MAATDNGSETNAGFGQKTAVGAHAGRPPGLWRFGNAELDERSTRLRVDGVDAELDHSCCELLLCLIRQAGSLVQKDELLRVGWPGRVVTENSLTKAIGRLRAALGDPEGLRLQSVRGYGYRLIGEVEAIAETAPAETAVVGSSDRGAPALSETPITDARRSIRLRPVIWAIAGVALLAAAGAIFLRPVRNALPNATHTSSVKLAILPFRTETDEPELRSALDSLTDSILDHFGRISSVESIGRDSVYALARSDSDPLALARRLDVDYVLSGQAEHAATGIHIRAALWQRGRGEALWSIAQDTTRENLFALQPQLIDRLRQSLLPASTEAAPLAVSEAAQRLYWLGRNAWYRRTPESLVYALELFKQAAAEDKNYALAYCGIADAYMLLYVYADLSLDEAVSKAQPALEKARKIDPGLVDILVSEGEILLETYRFQDSVAHLEQALRLNPNHPLAAFWYGYALHSEGRIRDAVNWYQSLRNDPDGTGRYNNLGEAQTMTGEREAANSSLSRAMELSPDYESTYWALALQERFYGNFGTALDWYAREQQRPDSNVWSVVNIAYTWLQRGDAQKALDILHARSGLSAIDRLDVETLALCALNRCDEALRIIATFKTGSADAMNLSASRARSLLLNGQRELARQEYASLFGAGQGDFIRFFRLWKSDLNLSIYSDWAAAQPSGSRERAAAISAYQGLIEQLQSNGLNLPLVSYELAKIAALKNDAKGAERELNAAIDRGWIDVTAAKTDLAWEPYHDAAWFVAARARIESTQAEAMTRH